MLGTESVFVNLKRLHNGNLRNSECMFFQVCPTPILAERDKALMHIFVIQKASTIGHFSGYKNVLEKTDYESNYITLIGLKSILFAFFSDHESKRSHRYSYLQEGLRKKESPTKKKFSYHF